MIVHQLTEDEPVGVVVAELAQAQEGCGEREGDAGRQVECDQPGANSSATGACGRRLPFAAKDSRRLSIMVFVMGVAAPGVRWGRATALSPASPAQSPPTSPARDAQRDLLRIREALTGAPGETTMEHSPQPRGAPSDAVIWW